MYIRPIENYMLCIVGKSPISFPKMERLMASFVISVWDAPGMSINIGLRSVQSVHRELFRTFKHTSSAFNVFTHALNMVARQPGCWDEMAVNSDDTS